MTRLTFARSLMFAAGAAIAAPAAWLAFRVVFESSTVASAWVWVFAAAAYLAVFASTPRHRFAAVAAALAAGTLLIVTVYDVEGVALGMSVVIAFFRSGFGSGFGHGFAPGKRRSRQLVAELALQGIGLAFAAWVGDRSLFGLSAAIWGYYVVQSLHPVVSGLRWTTPRHVIDDPFETSARRLRQLLSASARY